MTSRRTQDCTCPRCKKGHIPNSYTFGGYCPPAKSSNSPDMQGIIKHYEKMRREIDAALEKLKQADKDHKVNLYQLTRRKP